MMKLLIQRAALFLFISIVHSLPDFSCICEKNNTNACARTYSCHLNSTIDFTSTEAPDWVTVAEETLFVNTINDALSGELRPPFFSMGRMTWDATIACDDENGQLRWHHQINECRFSSKTNETVEKRRRHGWASLGFHPFGTQPGTWLTQILGEIDDANAGKDTQLMEAKCANTGLYVHVSYINASEPYDPRFSPAGGWGVLYAGAREYLVGDAGVPSYRTDNDLINNGVSLDCTGYDTTGQPCKQPDCMEPANITHYNCPAGVSWAGVGALNCSRTYKANQVVESGATRSKALLSIMGAGVLACALGFGI
jgi:hypothetical protein